MRLLLVLFLAKISFIQINLGVTQFTVTPTTQTVTEGALSSFECQHPHADIIIWTINETSLSSYATPDVVSYTRGPLHTLRIAARLVYNTSRVQCLAVFLNGQQSQVSPAAELIIQGTLNAVLHLAVIQYNLSEAILITWEAPFTLNITNTEPDITYCINIRNTPAAVNYGVDIATKCNITQTEFHYTITHELLCRSNNFYITVTPVNGAGYGVSETRVQDNTHEDLTISSDIIQISNERMELRLSIDHDITVHMCNCKLLLWKDTITQYNFNAANGLQCHSRASYLSFSTEMLPFNEIYEGSFFITKNSVHVNTSTHDIQDIVVSGSDQNSVYLKVSYVNGTKAKGAFVTFLAMSRSQKSSFSFIIPYNLSFMQLTAIPAGVYRVLAYDIEKEGHLNTPIAKPAITTTVAVLGSSTLEDSRDVNTEITAIVHLSQRTLTATCGYDLMSVADGCMIVVRSREHPENLVVHIQQRESPKQLVYSVEMNTNYTVMVLSITNDVVLNSTIISVEVFVDAGTTFNNGLHVDVYKIVSGTAISIGVIIIVTLVLVLISRGHRANCTTPQCVCKKKRCSNEIELHACEAYETTQKYRPRNA